MSEQIRLDKIFVPKNPDERIREDYGDVEELAEQLLTHGQLQPIEVEPYNEGTFLWRVTDGGRRIRALQLLTARVFLDSELVDRMGQRGLQPNHIKAATIQSLTPLERIVREFAFGEGRKDFTWREKAKAVRAYHSGKLKENAEWTPAETGQVFGLSQAQVYQYLAITENTEVFNSPAVQEATTFNTAQKQAKIVKAHEERKIVVKYLEEKAAEEIVDEDKFDHGVLATKLVYHGDCRDWIKTIPDESLSWFHWDPPYGTREGGGGPFSAHEAISMDPVEALILIYQMLPEIHRVLRPNAWFAMWYSFQFQEVAKRMLQGHVFEGGTCCMCGASIFDEDLFEGHYFCKGSKTRFWVNPFPNFWLKTEAGNDGHEIQRFLKKDVEPFYLAAKGDEPILPFSNRGNVFPHPVPRGESRRHVNQKPTSLLTDILSVISIGGEVGGDAGAGSGTIIEAAISSGRKIICAELREGDRNNCVEVATRVLESYNITSLGVELK